MISWLNEYFGALPDERALILGVAQTMGATFNTCLDSVVDFQYRDSGTVVSDGVCCLYGRGGGTGWGSCWNVVVEWKWASDGCFEKRGGGE